MSRHGASSVSRCTRDRKSTRLNSSHTVISYAVFCLKKKKMIISARAGIHDVAGRLANSKLYRDKGVDEILREYNPNASYPGNVKSVMPPTSPRTQQ